VIPRRRFKQTKPLKDRLLEEAHNLREGARLLPCGPLRDSALRRARHLETAAHMDDWLNSPGLRPPKKGPLGPVANEEPEQGGRTAPTQQTGGSDGSEEEAVGPRAQAGSRSGRRWSGL
jgi:hypothetical protein